MAERGKEGKRGYLKRVPRGLWGYNPYYDDNYCYDYEGKYRDRTEIEEGNIYYLLWDYLLMEKEHDIITLYSWDSATTQDRLNDISSYYHLPLYFTLHGGELYCKPLGWNKLDEWRYNKIVIDTKEKTISVYIDNEKGDTEKYNY
jgi:hypothetical protein